MIVCANKYHLYPLDWATDLNWPLPVACCRCAVENWMAKPENENVLSWISFFLVYNYIDMERNEETTLNFSSVLTVVLQQSNPEIHHIICIFLWSEFLSDLLKKSLKIWNESLCQRIGPESVSKINTTSVTITTHHCIIILMFLVLRLRLYCVNS